MNENMNRCTYAGQAVVQFATDRLSKEEFAVKFFIHRAAFEHEAAQYQSPDSPFKQFLPHSRSIVSNEDGAFVDATGNAMPPCIVVEKGESLDIWGQRNKRAMDPFTCMQVRAIFSKFFFKPLWPLSASCVNGK